MIIYVKNIMMTIGPIFPERLLRVNKCCLLIFTIFCLSSCYSVKEQQENVKYDSLTQRNVYFFVEKMPKYNGGDAAFITDFHKNFQYDFFKNEGEAIQTTLRIQFVIDTEGHLIGARIFDKRVDELTAFEKAGLKALNLMQNWQSGEHNGKSVNVLMTRMIHINLEF